MNSQRGAATIILGWISLLVLGGAALADSNLVQNVYLPFSAVNRSYFMPAGGNEQQKIENNFQGSENLIMKDHEKLYSNATQTRHRDTLLPPQNDYSCLAIFSSQQGAGKTFISLGLAQSLGTFDQRVLLLDLDSEKSDPCCVPLPTLTISADNLDFKSPTALLTAMTTLDGCFDYLRFNFSVPRDVLTAGYFIRNLFRQINEMGKSYDFLIFDTPSGMSELNLALLQMNITAVFISTADAESLFDNYELLKAVHLHLTSPDLYFIINRVMDLPNGEQAQHILRYAFQNFLKQEIKLLGMVPLDPALQSGDLSSQLLSDSSPALEKIRQIARWLVDNPGKSIQTSLLDCREAVERSKK